MSLNKAVMIVLLPAILMAAIIASGCTSAGSGTAPTATPGPITLRSGPAITNDTVVLTINGSVRDPMQLKPGDLYTYPTVVVNMSAMGMVRNENMSDVSWNGQDGMTIPAGADVNWQPGTGTDRIVSSDGPGFYFSGQDGGMPGADGGNMQAGPGGIMPFGAVNVTGISLNALLDAAHPSANVTNVTFIGTGGRTETIPLAEIKANADAAIVIIGQGMLQLSVPDVTDYRALPGLSGIIVS